MFRSDSPDYDELKIKYEILRTELLAEKAEQKKGHITGLSGVLKTLKEPSQEVSRQRIALDASGEILGNKSTSSSSHQNGIKKNRFASLAPPLAHGPITLIPQNGMNALAGAVARPKHPAEIRRLVRQKMTRCKRCKNRFVEKHLYERHLRDKHPLDYIAYLIQQEEEMQLMRAEEIEANRVEEITSGGFIPPQKEMESQNYDIDPSGIPLPGELTNGSVPRFDKFGVLHHPKRVYKKKISPQCPFCDKRYRNEHSLKKHIEKKHEDSVEFAQCLTCFKCVPSIESLPNHLCDMTYMCFECTPIRNLSNETRLYNHRAKFHRGYNSGFKCHVCNQKFLTPRKLRKHKKMSHVFTKTYPCHFCDELFTSETSVTTHERIHTGIIKFECKICDFKCNRFNAMEEHRKEEHGYICAICNAKEAEWSGIKNHTLNEHGGYLSSETNSGYIVSPRVWVMYKGE
uniref:C2H2-type domain-containing protein n=1 Tax=Panagrolaimus sp. ES5 TaxID=591445 RepID=A0AC34FK86_9BILA